MEETFLVDLVLWTCPLRGLPLIGGSPMKYFKSPLGPL